MDEEKSPYTPVDLNRGVTMRKDPETGIQVYMYKDDPGVYLSVHGKPLSRNFAEKAGFPVYELKKLHERKLRMGTALEQINKEFEGAEAKVGKVLETRGDFKLLDRGLDRADVVDGDGNVYNPQPLPLEVAKSVLEALAGPKPEDIPNTSLIRPKSTSGSTPPTSSPKVHALA